MYVKGVRSGTLCRVFLRSRDGTGSRPAPSATAGATTAAPILSSALDLSQDRGDGGAGRRPRLLRHGRRRRPRNHIDRQPGGLDNDARPDGTRLTAAALALVVAGCGSAAPARRRLRRRSSSSGGAYGGGGDTTTEAGLDRAAPEARRAVVTVAPVPKLGKVIVDSEGFTLYDFHKDKGTTSSCYGPAPSVWPPLTTDGQAEGRRRRVRRRSWARPSARTAPPRSPTRATRSTPTPRTRSRAKPTATTSTPSAASGTR